jgi:hypothetical protein
MALLTLPEHLSSPPLFSGIHIAQSLDLYVVVFLRLWYLETFVTTNIHRNVDSVCYD